MPRVAASSPQVEDLGLEAVGDVLALLEMKIYVKVLGSFRIFWFGMLFTSDAPLLQTAMRRRPAVCFMLDLVEGELAWVASREREVELRRIDSL